MGLRDRLRAGLRRRLVGSPPTPQTPRTPAEPPHARPPWAPLHAELRDDVRPLLHPALREALASGRPHAALRPLAPGLHRLPVLSEPARTLLLEELDAAHRAASWGQLDLAPPNSMNQAGLQLDEIGLRPLAEALCAVVVAPLAAAFPEQGPVVLGDPHGFTVRYGAGADRDLGFHADDATLTLNLCLQSDAEGAEVVFEGVRCLEHRQAPHRPDERVVWSPVAGEALLHLGAHRHRTLRIGGGARRNLVLWCRDMARIDLGPCGPWCGEAVAPRH